MNIFEKPLAITIPALQGELWTTQWILEGKLYINSCAYFSIIKVSVTSTGYMQEIAFKTRSVFFIFKNN